jgi:hypothetical protein
VITGNWELVLWQGAGVATSITGGVATLGMSMYGDLLDNDVSAGEMWKNAAIRGGLEAMETVSVMPVSLVSSLKGVSKAGKILRKSMHLMMLKGTLDTAVGIDWEKTMDKDTTWEMEDYRKMASMAQFMVELPELPLVGTLHEELLQQNKWPMKN